MISVDTKKREQLGAAHGRAGVAPEGRAGAGGGPQLLLTGPDVEQAIPYGIYDVTRNTGWVNVGVDHDTSVFAVESVRRWWKVRGGRGLPAGFPLADHRGWPCQPQLAPPFSGGSSGRRNTRWVRGLRWLVAGGRVGRRRLRRGSSLRG